MDPDMMVLRFVTPLLGSLALLLTGCSLTAPDAVQTNSDSSAMQGTVHGGDQPVVGATVTVWQMGTSGYGTGATQLSSVSTDANGSFQFASGAYTCAHSNAPVYITAQGGNPGSGSNANLMLAAGLGPCSSAPAQNVTINEVTTAAAAFALGQFFTTTLGGAPTTDFFGGPAAGSGTYNVGLVAANSNTIPTLVNNATGAANASSATRTIESAKINSIANTLSACVNSTGQTSATETTSTCGKLFNFTKPGSATRPADTLQAAVQMSLYPWRNVTALYNLATGSPAFVGLSTAPNDWTVAISYTSSSYGLGINFDSGVSTSSNIDIDASGKVWFPTNATANHGVAFFDPASGTFNGPYSTALVRPQYVAIDTTGLIWATDLSSSALVSNSTTSPATAGAAYTETSGASGGPLLVDTDNTILFAYTTTGALHSLGRINGSTVGVENANAFAGVPTGLTFNGNHYSTSHFVLAATASTSRGCSMEYTQTGQSYQGTQFSSGGSCASGGFVNSDSDEDDWLMSASTLSQFADVEGYTFFTPPVPISGPEGIAVDGAGIHWIANSTSKSVSTLSYTASNYDQTDYHQVSPVAYLHDSTHGNTMTAPYGIAIDRSGNVWVSNAGCVAVSATICTPTSFVMTEIIGAAAPTFTPLAYPVTQTGTRPTS